jgi:hypothetical protein
MVKNNNNESSKILKRWLSPRELELDVKCNPKMHQNAVQKCTT